jgi:hypothetical protein
MTAAKKSQPFDFSGVAKRLFDAHKDLERLEGADVTFEQMADRVSRAGARNFAPSQISNYQKGKDRPALDLLVAYGRVTNRDPGWLAFGSESGAPKEGRAQDAVKPGSLGEDITAPAVKQPAKRRAG